MEKHTAHRPWKTAKPRPANQFGPDAYDVCRYPLKSRPCLTCGASFESTGPHHRLCDRCRQDGEAVAC